MKDKKLPFKIFWKDQLRSVLNGRKEACITDLANEFEVRPETISRWVSYLEAEGFLKTRFEGLKRMVGLNEKTRPK